MGGKSSGNGASFANKASRDFVGTGSMTSRSPSFRMMASSPGNSNSRGILTALFRPFLKTLTWRSGLVLVRSFGICQAYAKRCNLSTLSFASEAPASASTLTPAALATCAYALSCRFRESEILNFLRDWGGALDTSPSPKAFHYPARYINSQRLTASVTKISHRLHTPVTRRLLASRQ